MEWAFEWAVYFLSNWKFLEVLEYLARKLFALNNYFEAWPTDEEAATARDDDFFEEDD